MSALGSTPRRVVALDRPGAPGERPAWSADGSKLACPTIDEESHPVVEILTLATQEIERVTLEGQYTAYHLSWSPDGRFFAYVDAISPSAETTELWIVGLSGESIALSDGTTEVWSPMWSPSGTSLLYISNRGGSRDLWFQAVDADAKPRGDAVALTTGLGIQAASLLADGTKVAYSQGGRYANAWRVPIFADRAATWSDAEQLTFDQAFIEFVALSPDGRRLAVNSNRNGFQDLWTLPSEGGTMEALTNDAAPDWMPAWSPDGSEIAFYTGRTGNRDIFVMPSDGGPMRQLTTREGGDIMPAWSPDGQRLAYTAIRDGNYDIWTMSATGEDQVQLTDFERFDNLPAWSPDGEWIAYTSSGDPGEGTFIKRVPAAGGEPEQVSVRPGGLPRWDPDGDSIYFSGRSQGRSNEYWEVTVADRTERLVADLSGKPGIQGGFACATDGEYLYFTWEEIIGDIWVMDVVWDE